VALNLSRQKMQGRFCSRLHKIMALALLNRKFDFVLPQISSSAPLICDRSSSSGGVSMVQSSLSLSSLIILLIKLSSVGRARRTSRALVLFNVNDYSEARSRLVSFELFFKASLSSSLRRRSKISLSRE
jgi:hypothetical protein